MATFLLRVWLPDRPGALGAVASRIGAVRGSVVGIDILEQGGGRVIDELVVELPSADLVPLLLAEVANVDGVDVEDVRPVVGGVRDHRLDALETAALLVEESAPSSLVLALARHAHHDFEADWVAIVRTDRHESVAEVGATPEEAWLSAFVAGMRSSLVATVSETGPEDVAWAPLPTGELALVMGRRGRAFRAVERKQAAALCRIADLRLAELSSRDARFGHPAAAM